MTSFLHSIAWERLQMREGHLSLRHDGQVYAAHRLPFGSYFSGYRLELGSLPTWPSTPIFARLEPEDDKSLETLRQLAKNYPLVETAAIQPRQTSLVTLLPEEQMILSRFASKFRYNLRLAERHGVEVSIHTSDALEQLPRFLDLLNQTAGRQKFRLHAAEHYRLLVEELAQDGMVRIAIAHKDGEDLAALLLIVHEGTATYLHGASSDQHKNMMAPHLLHWQTMLHAKSAGCHTYDLWGTHAVKDVEGWQPIPGHPSAGVTRFKLGFGGKIVEYPGSFDLVFQPFWYSAYTMLRGLRSGKRAFS